MRLKRIMLQMTLLTSLQATQALHRIVNVSTIMQNLLNKSFEEKFENKKIHELLISLNLAQCYSL